MKRPLLLATIGFVALTCAYTWPLAGRLGSALPHDTGDPLLVTWILWWSTHAVPLTAAWWNAPAFYPAPGVFAFSENLLGLAPITAPIIALTHSPVAAYNVAFLISYIASGLGAYFLTYVLTERHDASFIAGVAFAFAPYRLSHTHHLQLLSSYWMPIAIGALHKYVHAPRWRWAGLFAGSWLLQALACGYYFFFLTIFVLLWLAWFASYRLSRAAWVRLLGSWVVAGCLLAPLLLGYRSIHAFYGFKRSPVEVVNYSADIAGLWSVSPDALLWSRLHGAGVSSESEQFPGLMVLLLSVSGVVVALRSLRLEAATTGETGGAVDAAARSGVCARPAVSARTVASPPLVASAFKRNEAGHRIGFYSLTAVLMWILSLGPSPGFYARPLGLPGPYALLMHLPGFDGMRVPARLWMLSVLCLAVVAGLVIANIDSRRTRRLVATLAAIGLLLEGWPRAFPLAAAPPMQVTTTAGRARLGLPLRENETETMYGAIAQARPVFNGYSGYAAPQHFAMRDLLEQHDPRILDRLAAAAPIEVVVNTARDPAGEWRDFVSRRPGAKLVDTFDGWSSFELPATGAAAPAASDGTRLRVATMTASVNARDIGAVLDGDLATRWHSPAQAGGELVTADLGLEQRVSAVELCLGVYAGQYPRGLVIDISSDGLAWATVYTGGTALETYDAAVRSPREVPVTLPIHRDRVRFVRLRQTGSDPLYGWSIVELRVVR